MNATVTFALFYCKQYSGVILRHINLIISRIDNKEKLLTMMIWAFICMIRMNM